MRKSNEQSDDVELDGHSLLADDHINNKVGVLHKNLITEVRRVFFLLVVGFVVLFLFVWYQSHHTEAPASAHHTQQPQYIEHTSQSYIHKLDMLLTKIVETKATQSAPLAPPPPPSNFSRMPAMPAMPAFTGLPDIQYPLSAMRERAIDIMLDAILSVPVPTLVAPARLKASVRLAANALLENVTGDFVETGVFTGGASILLLKTLLAFEPKNSPKVLWAADSFEGFPDDVSISAEEEHALPDNLGLGIIGNNRGTKGGFSSSLDVFKKNLETHKIPPEKVQILKGFFSDTLPTAPIEKISFLRMDGDLYVSTMDAFNSLYPKLSKGGYIYIDDYGSFVGCRKAVEEYREKHGITDFMYPIKESSDEKDYRYEAVWWRKSTTN